MDKPHSFSYIGQKRPNLHIDDMTDAYLFLLKQPPEKIHKKIYNIGHDVTRCWTGAE